jgi:5,6-dimethylbenzimidazole synthase
MSRNFSYSDTDKEAIYRVMAERRDMRHFNGEPMDEALIHKLLHAAHTAPSVGLMQPWRFIRIKQAATREALHALVDKERALTADALGEQKQDFLKLKVEGILQCSALIVAALPDKRESYVFGRRTLPEMDLASLSCAIQNMWLAARAEGIGMGWVSLFDPDALKTLLNMPPDSHPIAILCIGPVDEFYEKPMLVLEDWKQETALSEFLFEDEWGVQAK